MSETHSNSIAVFLDTSYIRKKGFKHPDFQKLVEYAKLGQLKLYISHIAWEERRTQFLSDAIVQIENVQREFNDLRRQCPNNFILKHLPPPVLNIWGPDELELKSQEAMNAFACECQLNVVPIGNDHAERAWGRYFRTELPFDANQPDRTERRKDIPDSWILEAAIDLKEAHPNLVALIDDKRFSDAVRQILEIQVFKEATELLGELDTKREIAEIKTSASTSGSDSLHANNSHVPGALALVLDGVGAQFRLVSTKIIGIVSYLGNPTKDQVYKILEKSGISPSMQ